MAALPQFALQGRQSALERLSHKPSLPVSIHDRCKAVYGQRLP
jgi:hypothetical protein